MTRVLVVLSAYNGEKYISEQIDSILNQIDVEVSLIIRDDGSKDLTCQILNSYSEEYNNISVIYGNNEGFVRSFTILLSEAFRRDGFDYYAFSDQDDVWLPDKLKTACDKLDKRNSKIPLLFTSNSYFVDERLNVKGLFHSVSPFRTKENMMIYPTEQGCSMVFNRKAVELFLQAPPNIKWHDRWMVFICNFIGETIYDQRPLFYYRIHSQNVWGDEKSSLNQIYKDIRFILSGEKFDNLPMIKEFVRSFNKYLSESDKKILDIYINYHHSFRRKWLLIKNKNYQQSLSLPNRLRKSLLVLLNKI